MKKLVFRGAKKSFPQGEKFLCGSFSPFGRRCFSFRRALFFPSEEKKSSCPGKLIFLRRKNPLRAREKSLAFEGKRSAVRRVIFFFARTEINFLTYENFGPSPSVLFTPAEAFPEPSYERAGEGAIRRAKERLAKSLRGHRQILP